MKIIKRILLSIVVLVFIAINLLTLSNIKNGDISLDNLIDLALAQSSETQPRDPNVYFSSNPFDESGSYTDQYNVKWCWIHKGDWCNLKGNNCPNGKTDTYTMKKC